MDTRNEAKGLLREAKEDLARALQHVVVEDWVTATHYAQLAIEKSAKGVISCFEAFEWTHDPSKQIKKLVEKRLLGNDFLEVASCAREAAPWHGQSTYGRLVDGEWRTPAELCTEHVARKLAAEAQKVLTKAAGLIQGAPEG